MEKSIYETMKALEKTYKIYQRENYREDRLKDIYFLGAINVYKEIENTGKTGIEVIDVYVEVEDYSIPVLKFVDKDNNLIARRQGTFILPSSEYMWGSIPETETEKMLDFSFEKDKSLNYTRKKIKEIAKELNVSEEKILSIYEEDDTITEENKNEEEKDEQPRDTVKLKEKDEQNVKDTSMDAITKQETSLDQRVNDGKTLREILHLPENAQKLVWVETDSIANDSGNTNNTRFTPLYKDGNGKPHKIERLQMAGGNPNQSNVATVSEQGDDVQYTSVNSMYKTTETGETQYIFTANIGSHGVIDLGIGQMDKTQGINSMENETSVVTTKLKTSSTYYTSRDTRERINGERDGIHQATARRNEARLHEKCEHNKDVKDVDGKLDNREEVTEHTLESYAIMLTNRLTAKIGENALIRENYSYAELRNKIEKMLVENPDLVTSIENIDDTEVVVRETLNKELNDQEPVKTRWDTINRKTIA